MKRTVSENKKKKKRFSLFQIINWKSDCDDTKSNE